MSKKYYSIIFIFYLVLSGCLKDTPGALDNANKLPLDIVVVDAEYNQSTDRLYFLSAYPYELRIFNVNANTFDRVPLNYSPTCISVSANGRYAVVGHYNKISYIDLTTKNLKKEFDLPVNIFDIVLYDSINIIATTDNADSVYWINTNTEKLTMESFGTAYRSTIKLHPKSNYILGTTSFFYYKLSIENNKLVCLKSDSTSPDNLGYNFWFADNSNMVYSSSKNVLSVGESLTDKVNLASRLNANLNYFGIYSAVELKKTPKIYAAITTQNPNIGSLACFDANNYILLNILPLKNIPYQTNGKTEIATAGPGYVFTNSNGDKIIILTKGFFNYNGIGYKWGLEVMDVK